MEKASQQLVVSYFHSYKAVFELAQGLPDSTILEKLKQGGRCLRIKNFQGYSRSSMENFLELIKNNAEYTQGRPRKIHVKFTVVLGFDLEISEGCNILMLPNFQGWSFLRFFFGLEISEECNIHNFTKFPGVEFCFTWNFQGYREKPKQFQGFFFKKKYVLNPLFHPPPPVSFFLPEQPIPKQLT